MFAAQFSSQGKPFLTCLVERTLSSFLPLPPVLVSLDILCTGQLKQQTKLWSVSGQRNWATLTVLLLTVLTVLTLGLLQ